MIIYNIRANGPYEYDKFMLNYGQLHNLYRKLQKNWTNSKLLDLNKQLTTIIKNNAAENSRLNEIAILKRVISE